MAKAVRATTTSKFEQSWIQVRNNVPVENVFPRQMFQQAWEIEQNLEYLNPREDKNDAYDKVLKANREIATIINQMEGTLNAVYSDATEYKPVAKAFYRLIDMNLRFYRYAEIDQVMEQVTNTSGPVEHKITELQNNLERLLDAIKNSIREANAEFRELEEENDGEFKYDEDVVYLVSFAQYLESSLRYTAKYIGQTSDDEENGSGAVGDYYAIIEEAKATNAADQMNEQLEEEEEFVNNAEDRISQQFEQEEESGGDSRGFN